jgi:hypothetical protein
MNNINISAGSIKFLVDNEAWDVAAWACDSSCFANNPTQQIGEGLGELEVKAESLRYIVCTTRDLLEDSQFAIEPWLFGKASHAFGAQISNAILTGDGFGKPMGILNPAAGIPICETSENTVVGPILVARPGHAALGDSDGLPRGRRGVSHERPDLGAVFDDVGCEWPADHDCECVRGRAVLARWCAGRDRIANARLHTRRNSRGLWKLAAGLHGCQPQGRHRSKRSLLGRLLCPREVRGPYRGHGHLSARGALAARSLSTCTGQVRVLGAGRSRPPLSAGAPFFRCKSALASRSSAQDTTVRSRLHLQ